MRRWIARLVWRARRAIVARAGCVAQESGQSTAEYTLVLLVAATMALMLLTWVKGGGVTELFQRIFDKVVDMFA